jgi:hypothetical protein
MSPPTTYDSFRHRNTALQIVSLLAFIVFCLGAALSSKYDSHVFTALLWTGLGALIVCAYLLYAGNHCPRCQTKIRDVPISCPSCGLNFTSVEYGAKDI